MFFCCLCVYRNIYIQLKGKLARVNIGKGKRRQRWVSYNGDSIKKCFVCLLSGIKDAICNSFSQKADIWAQQPIKCPPPPSVLLKHACWLAGIVFGSVWATMFVSHSQSQDCVAYEQQRSFWLLTLNRQQEDREEQFFVFEKKCGIRIADFTFQSHRQGFFWVK